MLGNRLLLARKKAGLSMDALVESMGGLVTKQSLSKYERDLMMPSSNVLTKLSECLDVTLEFLFNSEIISLEGIDFRTESTTTAKDRAKVEAVVIEHLERYLAVEEIVEENVHSFNEKTKTIYNEDDIEAFALEMRERWDLGADPIPNITALLEEKGLKVLLLELPSKVFGLTCFVHCRNRKDPIPVVVANRLQTIERRRFTLAHELFHRLVELPDDSPLNEEKVVNHCAGAFLMPKKFLQSELASEQRVQISYQELISIKHRCGVSAAALLYRLGQTGIISSSSVSKAFRTFAQPWRSVEPNPINDHENRIEIPERFERLCYHALAEGYISIAKAMELLKKSVEELEIAIKGPSQDADYC